MGLISGISGGGRRVLVTRPRGQAGPWLEGLRGAGFIPVAWPTIEVGPPSDFSPMDKAQARLSRFDVLVFTSRNAAVYFWERWLMRERRAAQLGTSSTALPPIVAIGETTARAISETLSKRAPEQPPCEISSHRRDVGDGADPRQTASHCLRPISALRSRPRFWWRTSIGKKGCGTC